MARYGSNDLRATKLLAFFRTRNGAPHALCFSVSRQRSQLEASRCRSHPLSPFIPAFPIEDQSLQEGMCYPCSLHGLRIARNVERSVVNVQKRAFLPVPSLRSLG